MREEAANTSNPPPTLEGTGRMPIIETRHLRKVFRSVRRYPGVGGAIRSLFSREYVDKVAVEDINLVMEAGELVGYIGPNGAGKSTTIKMLTGILVPTSGEIRVAGLVPYQKRKENARNIGVVFGQRSQLYWDLPLRESFELLRAIYAVPRARYEENLAFFLRENLKLDESEVERRVREMIQFAQLEGYEDQLPDTLSGGMKKRLAIGRALIFGPSMVLLDEPTVGLDPLSTKRILDVIQRLREERGLGAVFVTHLISDVEAIADSVLILFKGKIVFDDVPKAMHESDHPFVMSFLKQPEEA